MPATRQVEPSSGKRAQSRRRPIAMALSLAAHAALLFAVVRAPLPLSEGRARSSAITPVVWLRELPAREATPATPPEPEAVERPSAAPAEANEKPRSERPQTPKRAAKSKPVEEPAPTAVGPAAPAQTEAPPHIDWDKER